MQYFGTIETKYEEIFLTQSYMYFNAEDEEITVKELKEKIKTAKDRKSSKRQQKIEKIAKIAKDRKKRAGCFWEGKHAASFYIEAGK